jgi:predicted amidophosphoribosyltransferase
MARAERDLVGPDTVLVPIPLHWRRRLARRYNQADILAHETASLIGAKVASDVLVHPRPTVPLEIASAAERYDRLRDAFALTGRAAQKLAGRSVILVDDVMTSGATLAAAAQTLQSAQPQKIDCLVLARVPQNDYIGGEEKD